MTFSESPDKTNYTFSFTLHCMVVNTCTHNILNNERVCRDIKTKKAQELEWDGTLETK